MALSISITDENFEEVVLKSKKLVVVNFTAAWCGPCRIVSPILSEIQEQYGDKIVIGNVDVDKDQKDAAKYGVRNIPTVLIFENGEVKHRFVGASSKTAYCDAINQTLGIAMEPVQEKKWTAAMISVTSSNLSTIGHQDNYGPAGEPVLRVTFSRGGIYEYWPVSKEQYLEGIRADNVTEWFNSEIKSKTYRKIE